MPVPLLAIGLLLLTLFVAFQLLPLPVRVLEAVASPNAAVQRDALSPIGLYSAWRPISLDPGATAQELGKLASWALVAAAAGLAATSRERRERLLAALAVAGAGVAVACFGAALAGVGRLTESRAVFINPNHLSAFMLLTCWIALGFGLRSFGPRKVAWLVAFVVTSSQVFLSLSRAGIAAYFVGAGAAVLLAIRSGHGSRLLARFAVDAPGQAWRAISAPLAVFSALAVTAWLALDSVVGELRTISEVTSEVKLSLWPLAWQALSQYPWLGMGRGAFATAFTPFKVEMTQVTFTHLENTWLQIPLDVGAPVGILFIALVAWTWVSAARSKELTRPMLGALAGVVAVAAHDVFDFSLELNGIAIPFLVVLALGSRDRVSMPLPRRPIRLVALALLLLGSGGLAAAYTHRADRQAAEVVAAASADEATVAALAALAWHPVDWVPVAAVGTKLVDEGRCPEGIAWLNRAMVRNPTAPQPHRAAARCLAASGQDEVAKREYRLAFVYGDTAALQEARDAFPQPGALLEIAPDTPAGLLTAGLLLAEAPAEAVEAYRRAWEAFHLPAALAGLARATLANDDPEKALELARELKALQPTETAGYLVTAEALGTLGEDEEAVRTLEEGAARLPKSADILFALGGRHIAEKRFSQAKLVFERIVAREGRESARKHLAIARALEFQGRFSEALREARAGADSLPGEAPPLLSIARIAEKSGLYDVALDAVDRAAKLPNAIPGAYDDQIKRLRADRASRQARWFEGHANDPTQSPQDAPQTKDARPPGSP